MLRKIALLTCLLTLLTGFVVMPRLAHADVQAVCLDGLQAQEIRMSHGQPPCQSNMRHRWLNAPGGHQIKVTPNRLQAHHAHCAVLWWQHILIEECWRVILGP